VEELLSFPPEKNPFFLGFVSESAVVVEFPDF
jgi:hypothetical protein